MSSNNNIFRLCRGTHANEEVIGVLCLWTNTDTLKLYINNKRFMEYIRLFFIIFDVNAMISEKMKFGFKCIA